MRLLGVKSRLVRGAGGERREEEREQISKGEFREAITRLKDVR